MNVFLIILCVLAGIIALLLLIALFTRKDYAIAKEITINRPKQEVFNYIKYLKNQDNYSKWNMADPNMKKEYKGTDGTVGFFYSWDSMDKKVGKGEQTITKITEGERMETQIRFIKPFAGIAQAFLAADAVSAQQTKVQWGMQSAMSYPMNIMLLFMSVDEILGKDLQEGLNNLKNNIEK